MTRARLIRLIRISVLAAVFAYLCSPICPASAAGGDAVLSAQEWFDRGRFMGEIGNYHKAVEAFSRVIELAPDSAHAYNNRGVAYSELGNYRLAIQDFNRAVHLNPEEVLFRFNRGVAFGKGEEYRPGDKGFQAGNRDGSAAFQRPFPSRPYPAEHARTRVIPAPTI